MALLSPALAVAALVALESLLSARVADGMVDVERHSPNRELVGQGIANVASALFGGMPATGALARTAVNARSGARTRLAALSHAMVLGALMFAAAGVVGRIPLVALAGVLLVTAYRMVERHADQGGRPIHAHRRRGVRPDGGGDRRVRPRRRRRNRGSVT